MNPRSLDGLVVVVDSRLSLKSLSITVGIVLVGELQLDSCQSVVRMYSLEVVGVCTQLQHTSIDWSMWLL